MLFPSKMSTQKPPPLQVNPLQPNMLTCLAGLSQIPKLEEVTCSNALFPMQIQTTPSFQTRRPGILQPTPFVESQPQCMNFTSLFQEKNKASSDQESPISSTMPYIQSKLENKEKAENMMNNSGRKTEMDAHPADLAIQNQEATHLCQIRKNCRYQRLLGIPNPAQSNYPQLPAYRHLLLLRYLLLNQAMIRKLKALQALRDFPDRVSLSQYHESNLTSVKKSEQNLEDVIIQRENLRVKVKEQIEKAQIDLLRVLREVPNEDKVIFQGKPRGRFRRNGQPFTSSEFRGVSKNGRKYQVRGYDKQMFIMVNGRNKMYMGGFDRAEHAARCYDKAAIQMRGLKAHTNFSYSKKEVLRILRSRPLFDMERENVAVPWRELRATFD